MVLLFFFCSGRGGGGGGGGIRGILEEICQKFLDYPGWQYNLVSPTSHLLGKTDSGRVDLQAI